MLHAQLWYRERNILLHLARMMREVENVMKNDEDTAIIIAFQSIVWHKMWKITVRHRYISYRKSYLKCLAYWQMLINIRLTSEKTHDKQLHWFIIAWNIKKFLVINKIRIDKLKRMTILKNDEKVGDVLVFGEYAVILSLLTSVYRCILVSFQCWNRWW